MKTMDKQTMGKILLITLGLMAGSFAVNAQLLNRVKDNVKQRAEDRVVNKSGEAADRAMDGIENAATSDDESEETSTSENENVEEGVDESSSDSNENSGAAQVVKPSAPTIQTFKSYDFVPGDKIIYEYDMEGEADSEIPGRMMVNEGSAEIQTVLGEKCMMVPDESSTCFTPLMSNESYLPEQYTIEFDFLLENPSAYNTIYMSLKSEDDSPCSYSGVHEITLDRHYDENFYSWRTNSSNGSSIKFPKATESDLAPMSGWKHVAIYVNKNIGKLYIDQHRIATVNTVKPGASRFEVMIQPEKQRVFFRNFRIAAGGTDAYNKVVTDGKFIAHGILFDVNKATLKPQSMGTINEIATMMKSHPDLKFEIGGHTDSDGSAETNQKLSLARAEAVKAQLVSLGIDASRLTVKGYGSSKPISDNLSQEGKASNRRVEFKKI